MEKNNMLDGKKFADLPIHLQERIEDTQLTLYILDVKAPDRAKLDIFERVNGGVPLTRQQMRNCINNGKSTIWLKKAASNQHFINATRRSLDSKSMRDREAINRFCAFRLLGVGAYKADMDGFLANTLELMNSQTDDELDALSTAFIRSMRNNYFLFRDHAFRKSLQSPNSSRTVINISFFDVCSYYFSYIQDLTVQKHADDFRKAVSDLLNSDNFLQSITYSTNGINQVKTRFSLMELALAEVVK